MLFNGYAREESARPLYVRRCVLVWIAILSSATVGQSDHTIKPHIIASGGGKVTSATHSVQATLGESLTGVGGSANHSVKAGFWAATIAQDPTSVRVDGRHLLVNGELFFVRGVGYGPVPVCEDPADLPHGDYFTVEYQAQYERDLEILRQLGANTVRLWGWNNKADHTDFLEKAYNNGDHPIYVIVGFWMPGGSPGQLCNEAYTEPIKTAFRQMVAAVKDHPAVLMWCIGNELNASWMYDNDPCFCDFLSELVGVARDEEGEIYHPVTTALMDTVKNPPGDDNLFSIIDTCEGLSPMVDIWGVNSYRGNSFGRLFVDYREHSQRPLVILEYGIDAYDHVNGDEYEFIGAPLQADYAEDLWTEIEDNADVCIGASIMAFRDELWKGKDTHPPPDSCPDLNHCTHSTCGYVTANHPDAFSDEEWWGIMRTVENEKNVDILEPRAAYYRLQELWRTRDCAPFHDPLESWKGVEQRGGECIPEPVEPLPVCCDNFHPAVNGDGVCLPGSGGPCRIRYTNELFTSGSGTVSLWFKKTSSDRQGGIWQIGQIGEANSLGVFYNNEDDLFFQMESTADMEQAACYDVLRPGEWTRIVARWSDRGTYTVLTLVVENEMDRCVDVSNHVSGPFVHNAGWMDVGADTYYHHAEGCIDELCFFDWPISEATLVDSTPVGSRPGSDDPGDTLWRSAHNVLRLTLNNNIVPPCAGGLEIREMLDDGLFGPDLSAGFTFTVEDNSGGDPRILRIEDTTSTPEDPILKHRKWYAFMNKGGWCGAAPFMIQYLVQMGDCKPDGIVISLDAGCVNACIPCFTDCGDDNRCDCDGDGRIISLDVGCVNAHIPSFAVPKPSGH